MRAPRGFVYRVGFARVGADALPAAPAFSEASRFPMKPFRTVGVIGKRREPHWPTLSSLCAALQALGCEVLVEHNDELPSLPAGERVGLAELGARAELAIVVGGDGTLLGAGRALAPAGVPLLGVNQGRLGFLVDLAPERMASSLADVIGGRYELEERLILSAQVERAGRLDHAYPAINDVVLRNQATMRMIEFESWMGDDFISLHRADGMIVCSPTGSTAYALSGGGPLIHPRLQAMALVPICPHTLSDRPIVIGADQSVRLVVCGDERTQATATLDGQLSLTLQPGDSITVRRHPTPLRLIHPTGSSYFEILRNKLRWGRNQDHTRER